MMVDLLGPKVCWSLTVLFKVLFIPDPSSDPSQHRWGVDIGPGRELAWRRRGRISIASPALGRGPGSLALLPIFLFLSQVPFALLPPSFTLVAGCRRYTAQQCLLQLLVV